MLQGFPSRSIRPQTNRYNYSSISIRPRTNRYNYSNVNSQIQNWLRFGMLNNSQSNTHKKKKKKITFRPKFLQTIIKRSFMPKLTIKKKKKFKDMRSEQRKGKK